MRRILVTDLLTVLLAFACCLVSLALALVVYVLREFRAYDLKTSRLLEEKMRKHDEELRL